MTPASQPSSPSIGTQPLTNEPQPQTGNMIGTVTDVNNAIVPRATVILEGPNGSDHRTVTANDNGYFQFQDVEPGIPYHVIVSAKGFADWTSPAITLNPGQYLILTECHIKIAEVETTVDVGYSVEQVAAEQVRAEEKQRVLGIVPNFFVSYDPNAAPLTAKLKFKLAFRTSIDPVTFAASAFIAGINQAADTPNYVQGAKGYGQRFGASYANNVSDIMIGGAILPALLHQDPRYFYQGTGTKKSRALHAMLYPFVCRGDNGRLQPNFSTIGGDLASSAITISYNPPGDNGVGMLFEDLIISTAERMASTLAQEFVLNRMTHKSKI
jgi:hypothetical protein